MAKGKRSTPPPTLAIKAAKAAKKMAAKLEKLAAKLADEALSEIADTTLKGYRSTVQSAIKQVSMGIGEITGIVAEEAAWMELSPTVRESMIDKKARALLKRPPIQLPASVQPMTMAEARREATSILKREAAKRLAMSPTQHAELSKELVGLYRGQAHAALEFRAELIRAGMAPDDVAREFKKLVAKKLEYRAKMIGGYETRKEAYTIQRQWWLENMQAGTLERTARKFVRISGEACPICQRIKARQGPPGGKRWNKAGNSKPMPVFTKDGKLRQYRVGVKVLKGKVWGQRWVPGPPFHINCRCYEVLIR